MALLPIEFGGMQSLEADELVGIGQALVASDCYLDKDTVIPRNGYRALSASALQGSGLSQLLARFRPSPTAARIVAGIAGQIWTVPDPSTETAVTVPISAGTPFGATAALSAAQLGRYLYLATDESAVAWNRMDSSYALVGLGSLAQGAQPAVGLSTLAVTKFSSLAAGTLTNAASVTTYTDTFVITPSAAGGGVVYNLGADTDWTAYGWLMVMVSPPTSSSGGGSIQVAVSTSGGSFETLGATHDTAGDDGPTVIFFPMNSLTAGTRSAARKIQIINKDNVRPFLCYGLMALPQAPLGGPQVYNVTFYNSTTHQESALSPDLTVTWATQTPTFPTYHSAPAHYNAFRDEDTAANTNPDVIPISRNFNKGGGTAYPSANDVANIPTFTGTIPTTDRYPSADTVRLWRVTSTGRRLVKAAPIIALQTTYSITDDQGDATLTHDLYRPQGTPPRASALTARAQRLIAGYENRVYISSFIPTSASNDPYPQFPDIPTDTSDGWSFDIAPSNVEQIQWLGNGDALYILTNEAAYVMTSLDPNSPPFKVFERGALGRRAACWAEEKLFYAGWDGVYSISNRVSVEELSQPIRRMYRSWLNPDSTTLVAYQGRKLYVICGTKYLRYDFVKERWTRGTLAHTMLHAAAWRDPTGAFPHLWYLSSGRNIYRWQPADVVGASNAATTDAGAALPAWTYQTGFEFTPNKGQIRKLYVDMSGPALQISVHTSMEDKDGRVKEYRQFSHESPQWADYTSYQFRFKITGLGGAILRRLLWERVPVAGEGASNQ